MFVRRSASLPRLSPRRSIFSRRCLNNVWREAKIPVGAGVSVRVRSCRVAEVLPSGAIHVVTNGVAATGPEYVSPPLAPLRRLRTSFGWPGADESDLSGDDWL